MGYAYPFPTCLTWSEDAAKIADLPLCIVYREADSAYELALTGGGMDLSWQICEAYMRLGQLPPFHSAGLPAMCGRGSSERDKWVIAGCRESVNQYVERAQNAAAYKRSTLDHVEEFAREA
jgi:hypothetical protein